MLRIHQDNVLFMTLILSFESIASEKGAFSSLVMLLVLNGVVSLEHRANRLATVKFSLDATLHITLMATFVERDDVNFVPLEKVLIARCHKNLICRSIYYNTKSHSCIITEYVDSLLSLSDWNLAPPAWKRFSRQGWSLA
ncbi:hypothetical protein D915_002014 [Fasciola hepatica]|uniref:Uncharacterized protein n=1 Tax=Fasciola hepatica TaxID=6192 RepID=A0A4E0S1W6_FASHE|nr:hypothetical protein D915_002014 [Fasciola hepatica]